MSSVVSSSSLFNSLYGGVKPGNTAVLMVMVSTMNALEEQICSLLESKELRSRSDKLYRNSEVAGEIRKALDSLFESRGVPDIRADSSSFANITASQDLRWLTLSWCMHLSALKMLVDYDPANECIIAFRGRLSKIK